MLKNNLSIFFGIFLVSMLFVPPSMSTTAAQDSEIPAWIKNNAGWWATDQIDDLSFLQGIQYLIKEGIMVIPPTETSESSGSEGIPTWIKNNAGWWADGQIDDGSFVSGIQWLVSNGIIVVEQKESVSSGSATELVYQTKVVSKTPHTVALIYSTQNDTCSADEKEKAKAYGIMAEYLVSKNMRPDPTQVTAYCMKLDEITSKTYTYVVKQIETQMPDLLIYVGGIEANLDAYDAKSSVWWWSCNKVTGHSVGGVKCIPNQIVVCDECKRWGVHMQDFEDDMDNGMWRLAATIGGANFYESFGDRWDDEAYNWASNTSISENQNAFDLCHEFDILENKLCSKLYEEVTILGETYLVMDIDYAKNNWRDEQKEVGKEIVKIVGTGSEFEGFSKFTLREVEGVFQLGVGLQTQLPSESALGSTSRDVKTTDVLTIEYPDDWEQDHYRYDWEIWNTTLTDPDSAIRYECCHVFQADNAILRVAAELWKDDTRETGPQYPWQYLASMSVWFLDNVHYGGATTEERFDALEGSERKYCSNATYGKNEYICRNFKVLEKTIYATDEGRKAYSLLTTYDITWANTYGDKLTYLGTTTEIYIGKDAWQVWTEFDEDLYEYSRDEIDRFNSSFVLLDTTYPIPAVTATPATTVTEDGIQYKATNAWEEFISSQSDEEVRGAINGTKISRYDVVCGTDCNISLVEHMDVDEIITKVWDGTDKEYDDWWYAEYGASSDNPHAGKIWDNEKQEWVKVELDKWIYETVDLKKFQDKKLHDEIWDIYTSITPKQIIEEIDTFLVSTDDAGGGAAHIARCIHEGAYGCGPPDTSNTKYVINFDPIDMAPVSGEREAYYNPGKLKDALEVDALKSTLIHENAHIMSLSASQSDNDLLGFEELCDYDPDSTLSYLDDCDDEKIRQTITQKEAACAPNFYDNWAGCLKEDSYLNKFYQKFWADIYREHYYGGKEVMSTFDFHQKYYDHFVSNYAATNPAEDFAESFTTFVLWDDELIDYYTKWCKSDQQFLSDVETGNNLVNEDGLSYWIYCEKIYRDNSIWEEKIRFFYDFPKLVEMRDFIRSNL